MPSVFENLPARITAGLRFRLTLTYVVFFTILLTFLGVFFRQTIKSIYDSHIHNILDEEWATVRGYLRIEKPKGRSNNKKPAVNWYYDRDDPEEALIVDRLKQAYIIADATGKVLEIGPKYRDLEVDSPEEIHQTLKSKDPVWRTKKTPDGEKYLIRSGVLIAEDDKPYYIALGRSYSEGNRILEQFTWAYSVILPLMIMSASLLGWFMAGRALAPVNDVSRAAQRITGSNFAVQIPLRGSDDELDRLIESFNRMIERLDASFQQTRQFSTDVSHELRTPLTAIRGQLEVALLAATSIDQYKEAVLTALVDVERLSQTVRALLLLSQAESGQLVLQLQRLDLTALINDIVEQFEIPAEATKLKLVTDLPPQCFVEADRVQMERLISNLLSNAVKYTPEGGTIRVGVSESLNEAEIVVEDTGVGIAPDHLPNIFDRFYRVPEPLSGRRERSPERGLGLGLSFVAWIVKAHRGQIDVTSKPGEGTRFVIRLPIGNVSSAEPASSPAAVQA